jgi:hypothetical protein
MHQLLPMDAPGGSVMEHLWTALFCTIHLCLGFLFGRAMRRESGPYIPDDLAPALMQFQQALGAARPALAELPEQFQSTVRELQQSVARLEEELAKERKRKLANRLQSAEENSVPEVGRNDVSPVEKNAADQRGAERQGYAVPEYMALFDEDLQTIGDFEQVQCHDLSATGVSFFLDRHLDAGDSLLITLVLGQSEKLGLA